jgi:hypothetical protein
MLDFIIKVLAVIIPVLIEQLRKILTPERFVELGDKLLDWCERAIQANEDWYDEWLLELIKIVREMCDIPDLPDEPIE